MQSAAKFATLAREKGCTWGQLTLAWVQAQGDDIVPIPGPGDGATLEENLAAVDVVLTPEDLARMDAEVPPAVGDRTDAAGMATVDR